MPQAFAKGKKLDPLVEPNFEQRMIQTNIQVSEWFDGVAEGIDLFLVGKQKTRDRNQTRVTLEHTTYSFEDRSLKNNFSLGIFPRFPNLEKYWALKFTSYDEKETRRGARANYVGQTRRRQNYGATAAWYRKIGNVRTSFEPRIELQDPLRISHSLSFDSSAQFENFEIRPKLELYASARRGPGFYQGLNFNYFLSKIYTLSLINQGDYVDNTRTLSVNNGISLAHDVSKKTSMSYTFMTTSINRPNYHLDGYTVSVSFNEMVYKKIFDYTITPYVEFLKANSFTGQVGGILNLRLMF